MQNNIIHKQINYFCKHKPEYALNIAQKNNNVYILIKGPEGSDFEGGEYVLHLECKDDYPFSPPTIRMLTPNGRFKTDEKICTSFSSYHADTWSPAINFNVITLSVLSFMLDLDAKHVGRVDAINHLDIKKYAKDSQTYNKKSISIQSIHWLLS
jgi:ubiquitin-protein ligase